MPADVQQDPDVILVCAHDDDRFAPKFYHYEIPGPGEAARVRGAKPMFQHEALEIVLEQLGTGVEVARQGPTRSLPADEFG